MNDRPCIFDRDLLRSHRQQAPRRFSFLHEWTIRAIDERLQMVRRDFPVAVLIGGDETSGWSSPQIQTLFTFDIAGKPSIQGDEEFLPLAPHSLDLLLSCLTLHSVNDLPGALLQMRQALRPDGLFLAALIGGESLYELRTVLAEAESRLRGGLSPRIFPFASKPDCAGLMQRAGFSLPVVDSETITVTYESLFNLIEDLRDAGATNILLDRDKRFSGRNIFIEADRLYREKFADPDGRIRATVEVIFMIGWAPHASQPQPLARGSATHSLADVLNSD